MGDLRELVNEYIELFDESDNDDLFSLYSKENLAKFVELDPEDPGRFALNAIYLAVIYEEHETSIECCNKAIELEPDNAEWYSERAKLKKRVLNQIDSAIEDYTKAIELEPDNAEWYIRRAECYAVQGGHKKEALADYTKAIELEPDNPKRYIARANCYADWGGHKKEAITDYTKAIELEPDNAKRYIARANCYADWEGHKKEALADYTKAIEIEPENAILYAERGKFYINEKQYEDAIADYTKATELKPGSHVFYAKRAGVHYKKEDYSRAIEDCNTALEMDETKADAYFIRAVSLMKMDGNIDKIDNDILKAIELSKSFLVFYTFLCNLYDAKDYQRIVRLEKRFDWKSLEEYGNISIDPENFLQYPCDDYYDRTEKDSVVLAITGSANYFIGNYESSVNLLEEAFDSCEAINQICYKCFIDPSEAWKELSKERVSKAKIEERNRIIADLSHSIKNLIATVIDPLQDLKQTSSFKPQVIDNAIRGANLIREIVNAMNLSFKSSIDDFIHDVKHNQSGEAMSIYQMVTESLKHSAGNMFDGKYFEKFMRKYFPTKDAFIQARDEWSEATADNDLDQITAVLSEHFLRTEISLDGADGFLMGNEKGSAVKMLILFQEMILNAVKYAAYAPKDQRFMSIRLTEEAHQLAFTVENTYDPAIRMKSSGLGHVIIRNFAVILGDEPSISKENGIHTITVRFPHFWKKEAYENLVRGRRIVQEHPEDHQTVQ